MGLCPRFIVAHHIAGPCPQAARTCATRPLSPYPSGSILKLSNQYCWPSAPFSTV